MLATLAIASEANLLERRGSFRNDGFRLRRERGNLLGRPTVFSRLVDDRFEERASFEAVPPFPDEDPKNFRFVEPSTGVPLRFRVRSDLA